MKKNLKIYGYLISMAAFLFLNITNVNKSAVLCCFVTILLLSVPALKSRLFATEKFRLNSGYTIIGLLFCSMLAYNFFDAWAKTDKLNGISSAIGMEAQNIVFFIALAGAITAIPVTSIIFSHFVKEGQYFFKNNNCLTERGNRRVFSSGKAFVILTVILLIGISAIIRADFNYIDDMGRIAEGYKGWENFSRFISNGLATMLYMNNYITDISPLLQLIAVILVALGGIILINTVYERKEFTIWEIIALVPLGLNPYFLECVSYKFDSPFMALSILVSVIPLIFRKSDSGTYILASAVGTIVMCTTYQASSGIFPMLVVLLAFRMWMRSEKIKQIIKFIVESIVGYGTGLLFFQMVIRIPAADNVSISLPELSDFLPTIVNNLVKYYNQVRVDFAPLWLSILLLIAVSFIWSEMIKTKRNKVLTLGMTGIALSILLLLCFGIYPALRLPSFSPRAMYGFGVLITILCICVAEHCRILYMQLPVAVISWIFLIFSLTYGNALYVQKTYTDFRITQVISDLNDMEVFAGEKPVTVQISGSIGLSPVIQPMSNVYNMLNRLIPVTFQESWVWGLRGFYGYYDLKNVVWDSSQNLETYNLPLLHDGMYHSIYGNDEFVLVELK